MHLILNYIKHKLHQIKEYLTLDINANNSHHIVLENSDLLEVLAVTFLDKITIGGRIFIVKYVPPFTKFCGIVPRPFSYYTICCYDPVVNETELLDIAYSKACIYKLMNKYEKEYNQLSNEKASS